MFKHAVLQNPMLSTFSIFQRLAFNSSSEVASRYIFLGKYQLGPVVHDHITSLPLSLIKLIVLMLHEESDGSVP